MKHVETLTGTGTLMRAPGQQVCVHYDLDVLQEEVHAGPGQPPIPGLKKLTGRVTTADTDEIPGAPGEILTLEITDGRKLKVFFTDLEGNIALNQWIG